MKQTITFKSAATDIIGDLYYPDIVNYDTPLPAIVTVGPLAAVKDQVSGLYAQKLANYGFLTLAFDHRHFGLSSGEPRQLESPPHKVIDIRAALGFMQSHRDVDKEKISLVGICAGSGYAARAAALDHRISALVTIAGFYHDPKAMLRWLGETEYHRKITQAIKSSQVFQNTAQMAYIPVVSDNPNDLSVAIPGDEPYAYYSTARGNVSTYKNQFALASYADLLQFDVISFAEDITSPTLVIHGKTDLYCSPEGAQRFYDELSCPKDLIWFDSSKHFDLYDNEKYVNQAVIKIKDWLTSKLTKPLVETDPVL